MWILAGMIKNFVSAGEIKKGQSLNQMWQICWTIWSWIWIRSTRDFCKRALRSKCHLLFFPCNVWFQNYLLPGVSFPSTYYHRRHFRSMNQSWIMYLNPGPCNFTIHFSGSGSFSHNSGNLSGDCMDVLYGWKQLLQVASHHWSSWPLYVYSTQQ